MRSNPPSTRDSTNCSLGTVSQHARSSTFGQYRNNRWAVEGRTRVWTCWSRGFSFRRAVVKDLMIPDLHIETISRVWRLGRVMRDLTNNSVALLVTYAKSTTRVLWKVRTSVGVLVHKWRTVPHIGSEMMVPQQNPTPGHHLHSNRRVRPPNHPTHDIVLPSLHEGHLPHRSTRRAQSQ